MPPAASPSADAADARRAALLDAATAVFLRFGYKKTSMDEVARAAGLSRPGLYLHFSSKEVLFREAIVHLLGRAQAEATAALADPALSLEERVVGALVAVHAHHVGSSVVSQQHVAELLETTAALADDAISVHEREFCGAVAAAIAAGVRDGGWMVPGMTPAALADLLLVLSVGQKHRSTTVDQYTTWMRAAVRALCRSRA